MLEKNHTEIVQQQTTIYRRDIPNIKPIGNANNAVGNFFKQELVLEIDV